MRKNQKLFIYNTVSPFLPNGRISMRIRTWMLRLCGVKADKCAKISGTAKFRGEGEIEIGADVVVAPEAIVFSEGNSTVDIGKGTYVAQGAYLSACDGILRIGERCSIGNRTLIQAQGSKITIMHHTLIAHMCSIKTVTHIISPAEECIGGKITYGNITIGQGVWMCAGVVVIPGVTIGEKSVIAAGACVIRDVPSYSLAAGVPATVRKNYALA